MADSPDRAARNIAENPSNSAPIVLNTAGYTTIVSARPGRMYFWIKNIGFQGVFVKLAAAGGGAVLVDIELGAGEEWAMPDRSVYTGEISAIAVANGPSVSFVEY